MTTVIYALNYKNAEKIAKRFRLTDWVYFKPTTKTTGMTFTSCIFDEYER